MLIVDRMEKDVLLCEQSGARMVRIPMALLSGPAQEGDLLAPTVAGRFCVDAEATAARKQQVRAARAIAIG